MNKTLSIFDIDGTVANDSHRVKYALQKKWTEYFKPGRVLADALIPQGLAYVELALSSGHDVAYMTGRRSDLLPATLSWLSKVGLPTNVKMYMRPLVSTTTPRPRLADLKTAYLKTISATAEYSTILLYEDDPEVVRVVNEATYADGVEVRAILVPWADKPKELVKLAQH